MTFSSRGTILSVTRSKDQASIDQRLDCARPKSREWGRGYHVSLRLRSYFDHLGHLRQVLPGRSPVWSRHHSLSTVARRLRPANHMPDICRNSRYSVGCGERVRGHTNHVRSSAEDWASVGEESHSDHVSTMLAKNPPTLQDLNPITFLVCGALGSVKSPGVLKRASW